MAELFVATGNAFAHLTEGVERWTAQLSLVDQAIRCLAVHPHDPHVLYAGSESTGLWRSDNRGRAWRNLALPESNVYSVAVSAANGHVYAGTEPSKLFVSADEGQTWRELKALRDIPSAPTWRFPPRPWTSHVRWIAPNPADGQLLLVGIELGGVMLSTDGGETWFDHRPQAVKDAHQLAWHPRQTHRAYEAGGGGAAWSQDGGRTWQALDEGREHHYVWALAVDPRDATQWFVAAAASAAHAHYRTNEARAALYRWRASGPWEPLSSLAKTRTVMPYALAISSGRLFAGFADGTIFSSDDDGDSWQEVVQEDETLTHITAMEVLP